MAFLAAVIFFVLTAPYWIVVGAIKLIIRIWKEGL